MKQVKHERFRASKWLHHAGLSCFKNKNKAVIILKQNETRIIVRLNKKRERLSALSLCNL